MQTAYGSRSAMSLAGDAVILCLLAAIAPLAVSAQNNWLQLSWAQLPFMGSSPPGRFSSACAWDAVKSELYCAGGSTGPVGDFNEMRDLWMWDGTTGAWQPADTSTAPFAPQREIGTTAASLALLGDTYYLFGGQDSSAVFDSLWEYKAGVWQLLPSLKNQPCANWPLPRFSHSVITRQSSFVIFGGSGMFWPFNDMWQFTVASCWTQLNVTNTSVVPNMFRHMAAYDPTGDMMYVSGGIYISSSTANASTVLWQYSFGSSSWSAIALATPFEWRIDAAMVCHGSALWQWGGALFPTFEMANMDLYRLDLSASPSTRAWIRVTTTSAAGFFPPRPRAAISYAYIPNGIPFLNTNQPGMLVFAGYSPRQAKGISHSSLYFLDLVSQQWQQIKGSARYPEARKYHTSVMIGVHLYVFGGLNERQETLQDVWLGEVTPDTNQRVVPWTVEWRPVTILSNGPSPRSKHAAAATAGQMYVFGGEGVPVQAGRHVIYSDMWAFSPQNLVWTQVIVPGPSPTGRFGHSMTLIGASKLYVFGGTTANGISTELWQFSPDSQSWRQITQLMSDAIWPSPTTAHAASEFIVIADAATAFVYNNYASNIVALIAQTLPNATMTAVNLAPFRASAAQAALIREDSDLRFLVVFGGYSDVSNMVTGELWLFDTITSTWSAPMMYQPGTDTTTPRRYATMFASADSIFIHGGFLYNQMSTSSIGYLQIRPWTTNTSGVTYSFPWSSWGTAQNGGLNNVLGIPSALSATQWLSLSPISFKAFQPNFKSQDAVALLRVNVSGFASQPPQTVGVTDNRFRRAAHSLTRLGDAVFFFGGMSAQVNSIQPSVNFASASNQLLALAVAPLCTKRQATVALASFPSGFRQTFVASERCFVCSRGSYAKFAANGNVSCVICGPGTYAQSPGTADQCTPCPAGFFFSGYGAVGVQLCAACPPGTFSSALGASSCQPCPTGGVCPVLTTVPFTLATMENTRDAAIISSQPPNLPSYAGDVNRAFWMLGYVLGGSWFLIGCISVCMYKSGKYRHNLRKLDIFFFSEHDECTKPVDAGVEEWRSLLVTEWQTELGGIWSMFFFLIGATFISFFLIPYLLGNTLEKRSLVPLLSVDPVVVPLVNGSFVIKLALYGYAQSCVLPGTDSVCDPLIAVRGAQSWPIVSAQQLMCRFTPLTATLDSTCWVTWQCTSCQVAPGGTTIGFVLDQSFALAKSISWSLSSTTGVANAQGDLSSNLPSTTSSTIVPDLSDLVFRSYTPSVVTIEATPTTFVPEVSALPINTGYHLQYMSHVKGSQVPSATLAYFRGLAFQFNITVSNNMFQIVRSNQTTILSFVSQLIGALNALLTGFAALLTIVERRVWGKDEENARIDRQKRLNMAVSSQKQAAASVAEVGGEGGVNAARSPSNQQSAGTASQSAPHGSNANWTNSPLAPGYGDELPLVSPSHLSSTRSSRGTSAGPVHAVGDSSVTIEMHAPPTASVRQHPSLSQTVARTETARAITARDQIAGTASQRKSAVAHPAAARLPTLTSRKSGD